MNNQLSKKIGLNHDPSEISDSESVFSNEDKLNGKATKKNGKRQSDVKI